MSKVRHVLGISGGKDSAALAIYMKDKYPSLDVEYYTCDTGKELDETYQLITNLETYLGKKIIRLTATETDPDKQHKDPFDHFLSLYGGYLPSSVSRWCTKKLKLEPFEKYVGDDPVISYVGIRGDEDREGYISKKSNIQAIFPFRKNIWSEDVVSKFLSNSRIDENVALYNAIENSGGIKNRFIEILRKPINPSFSQMQKLHLLLDLNIVDFNKIVFSFLKTTNYPLSSEVDFPLVENNEILVRADIFKLLEDSQVGVPAYYKELPFEINGKQSTYARSRSGCFFCFYQQKIEWIWLYETHPDLYMRAMEYEKDGYTWAQDESLADLIKPERMASIKEDYIKRKARSVKNQNKDWKEVLLDEAEGEGCASCFI
jgi:3'-phosphoadenosine 5'-phosphosulfate sulfotransferase (PAPS reductase)/FAD synthetase